MISTWYLLLRTSIPFLASEKLKRGNERKKGPKNIFPGVGRVPSSVGSQCAPTWARVFMKLPLCVKRLAGMFLFILHNSCGCEVSPLEKEMATHSNILARKSRGQRSPAGYSPVDSQRVRQGLATKQVEYTFVCIYMLMGEGNGTPLQYCCPENPMDGGAWWAAVHGVAKSQTRLSDFTFTFHLHALEKEMATHSSVLAWRIPGTGTERPGRLQSMGSHRVGHD